jgi:Flp pilus assembly protein TadD
MMREFHPEYASGASLLAQVLNRRGETARAEALLQFSRQIHDPALVDPWQAALLEDCYDNQRLAIIAEQFLTTGQVDEARQLLGRMEELDPTSWIPPAVRGWSQAQAGHHLEAVAEYRAALQKGGDAERICPLLAASFLALSRAAEAASMLAEYQTKFPGSIPLLRAAAEVAVWQGDEKQARILLTKVLMAEPYLQAANKSLALILWKAGEREAAARCLQRVVQVYPAEVDARGLLGQYYLEKNDPRAAIPLLEQALAHLPASDPRRQRLTAMLGTACRMAGSLAAAQGDYGEAGRLADQAMTYLPEELRVYALKAQVCLQLKQYAPARQALQKMLTLAPGNPTVLLHLGDATYLAGDKAEARQHWEKARQRVTASDGELTAALDARLKGPFPAQLIP